MRAFVSFTLALALALGASARAADAPKIGFVADAAGFGRNTFNDAILSGLDACARASGARIEHVVPAGAEGIYRALVLYATVDATEIVTQGGAAAHDVDTVARRFPNAHFTIIDALVPEPNVASVTFAETDGAFVAGALAALVSRHGRVGFVGGMRSQRLDAIAGAFAAGARYAVPAVRAETAWAGSFAAPAAGRTAAAGLAERGADVLYVVAGPAGIGALRLTGERAGLYAIGTDVDQDAVVPGKILTSIVKRVDVPARIACEQGIAQKAPSGHVVLGFAQGGLALTSFRYTRAAIGAARLARLERIRRAVADGTVSVPGDRRETAAAAR